MYTNKIIKLALPILMIVFSLGCGGKKADFVNRPPRMPKIEPVDFFKAASESAENESVEGKEKSLTAQLDIKSFSLVFLPEGLSEETMVERNAKVMSISAKLDELEFQGVQLHKQFAALLSQSNQDPAMLSKLALIKEQLEAEGKKQYGDLLGMVASQEIQLNQLLSGNKMGNIQFVRPAGGGSDAKNLDAALVNGMTSGIKLALIRINGFLDSSLTFQSQLPSKSKGKKCNEVCLIRDVRFDEHARTLSFTLPEVQVVQTLDAETNESKVEYIATGGLYNLEFEYSYDKLGRVRFVGDVVYKSASGKIRKGSAKIVTEAHQSSSDI